MSNHDPYSDFAVRRRQAVFFEVLSTNARRLSSTSSLPQCGQTISPSSYWLGGVTFWKIFLQRWQKNMGSGMAGFPTQRNAKNSRPKSVQVQCAKTSQERAWNRSGEARMFLRRCRCGCPRACWIVSTSWICGIGWHVAVACGAGMSASLLSRNQICVHVGQESSLVHRCSPLIRGMGSAAGRGGGGVGRNYLQRSV